MWTDGAMHFRYDAIENVDNTIVAPQTATFTDSNTTTQQGNTDECLTASITHGTTALTISPTHDLNEAGRS